MSILKQHLRREPGSFIGWADGHHMNIEYWEIRFVPDLKNKCWIGSDEEYFRLYEVASKYLRDSIRKSR